MLIENNVIFTKEDFGSLEYQKADKYYHSSPTQDTINLIHARVVEEQYPLSLIKQQDGVRLGGLKDPPS